MRALLFFIVFGILSAAQAQILSAVVNCELGNRSLRLYSEQRGGFRDGHSFQTLTPGAAGTPVLLGAYLRKGQLEMPFGQGPKRIPFSNCAPLKPAALEDDPPQDILMTVQTYFITNAQAHQDVESIEKLIARGEAIPVRVRAVCRTREMTDSPTACESLRILEHRIEVGPRGFGRLPASDKPARLVLRSGLCGKESLVSAIVPMQHKNESALVTSFAAVATGVTPACHVITDAAGNKFRATVERIDPGLGLARLKTQEPIATASYSLPAKIEDAWPDRLVLESGSSPELDVLQMSSRRHFIPKLTGAIEAKSPVDLQSSVVGTAVTDNKGELRGIVSHQRLQQLPGSITRPVRWNLLGEDRGNHLVVIPAEAIRVWLENSEEDARLVTRSSAIDPAASQSIASGRLRFEELCVSVHDKSPGGNAPIGGGAAVGIGGDDNRNRACKMRVSLDPLSTSVLFFKPALQAWHDRLAAALKEPNASVEIPLIAHRERGKLRRKLVYSLESFLKELWNIKTPETELPIWLPGTGSGKMTERTLSLARELSELSLKIYHMNDLGEHPAAEVVRRVYLLATILQSSEPDLVKPSDLDELFEDQDYKAGWNLIGPMIFQGGRLNKLALELRAEVKKQ